MFFTTLRRVFYLKVNFKFLLMLTLFFCQASLFKAQEAGLGVVDCGASEGSSATYAPSQLNHCFDVAYIQQSCTKLWLRMNIHFFLYDDCSGTIDPVGTEMINAEDAYAVAEDLIDRSNLALENNYPQWMQDPFWGWTDPPKPAQCVPYRYVLSGVYIHCNTVAKNTSGGISSFFLDNFGVNTSTEYNVFLVNYPGGPNGASFTPSNGFTTENFSTAVFNHEMGHTLNLKHSWIDNDFVADTPPIRYQFDYNCDGDLLDNYPSPGVGSESKQRQCWTIASPYGPLNYTGDGTPEYSEACDLPPPCQEEYPCCSWLYGNNNIMAYSGYTECCAAFTEGQITRLLENLSTDTYCAYIEEITGEDCLPPMANLHLLPWEFEEDDCSFCFQLSASMHEANYRLDFYNASGALHYTTGWKSGPANRFCLSKAVHNAYPYGFQPGQSYTVNLIVENLCGDTANEQITFTLPDLDCVEEPPHERVKITNIYANPFTQQLHFAYELEDAGNLVISLYPAVNPSGPITLATIHQHQTGQYQRNFSGLQISNGIYYLVLSLDGEIAAETVVKQ